MSEFIGDGPQNEDSFEGDDTNEDLNAFEADPATVAFLDQQAAEFRDLAPKFTENYGFVHECHCDKDYSEGKIVEVTECFAGMIVDSLETNARLNLENKALKEMLSQMFKLNGALVDAGDSAGDSESVEGATETSVGGTAEGNSGASLTDIGTP